jgi:hypothetical protein
MGNFPVPLLLIYFVIVVLPVDVTYFRALRSIDWEFAAPGREVKRNRMVLNYSTTNGSHVILTGINENKDSINVVLDRVQRNYA